jgi:hypothetical protein
MFAGDSFVVQVLHKFSGFCAVVEILNFIPIYIFRLLIKNIYLKYIFSFCTSTLSPYYSLFRWLLFILCYLSYCLIPSTRY